MPQVVIGRGVRDLWQSAYQGFPDAGAPVRRVEGLAGWGGEQQPARRRCEALAMLVQGIHAQLEDRDITNPVYRVEAKGVSGNMPITLLTRNEERAARENDTWRLAIVTRALTGPHVRIVDSAAALTASEPFTFTVNLTHA